MPRPSATSSRWLARIRPPTHTARQLAVPDGEAGEIGAETLAGLIRVDCAHTQEEAQVVALVLREALETPGRTAALVTPDRELARRVAAELARFGIGIRIR